MFVFPPGSHLLKLSVDKIVEDLRHRLDHVGVLCLGEQPGAHAEHVHAGLDGGRLAPLGVDRHLPPPGLRVVYDVVVKQGAGVEHLADDGHLFLQLRDPRRLRDL